jgi:predicted RNase H-like HicB family nuclease
MKFRIVLEFDRRGQQFLSDLFRTSRLCFGGDTEQEARQNIEEAVRLYLAPSRLD